MDAGEGEKKKTVSEEDAAEAVAMKNKANEFFKSEYIRPKYRGLGVKHPLYLPAL